MDEILNLIESVSEGFPSYSCTIKYMFTVAYLMRQATVSGDKSMHIYTKRQFYEPSESTHLDTVGVPVAQWVKRWPSDLADRVRSSLEVSSSQP